MRTCGPLPVSACMRACVRACVRARAFVRAGVRACVRACLCVHVCVKERVHVCKVILIAHRDGDGAVTQERFIDTKIVPFSSGLVILSVAQ